MNSLPESVWIDGVEYPINTDFRVSIDFETCMLDASLTVTEKQERALQLYYGGVPWDIETALEAAIAFYRCDPDFDAERAQEDADKVERPIYSYEKDFKYLYAAFLEQYRIDLYTVKNLHWWKFKAMFESLNDETQMKKIMGYRSAKVEKWMSPDQKSEIKRLHRMWDLPLHEVDKAAEDALVAALMGDGKVDAVMEKAGE